MIRTSSGQQDRRSLQGSDKKGTSTSTLNSKGPVKEGIVSGTRRLADLDSQGRSPQSKGRDQRERLLSSQDRQEIKGQISTREGQIHSHTSRIRLSPSKDHHKSSSSSSSSSSPPRFLSEGRDRDVPRLTFCSSLLWPWVLCVADERRDKQTMKNPNNAKNLAKKKRKEKKEKGGKNPEPPIGWRTLQQPMA